MRRRERVYRPLSRAGVVGNIALIAFAIAVAFFFGLQPLTLPVVLANVLIAFTLAGLLGFLGSGWAIAGLAVAFFGGPLAARFVLVGAQLSVQTWYMSLIAGWTLGSLIRRSVDRDLPGHDAAAGPLLQWWIRGRRYVLRAPTVAQVEAKIRALDGRERTVVIVMDGARQINVCGDAARALIVFRTADVTDDERWEIPLGGPVDATDVIEIAMSNASAPVARGLTLDVASAMPIVAAFLARKEIEGVAGTWRGAEVLTVRPSLP